MIELAIAITLASPQEITVGSAYSDSFYAATVTAGTYENGDSEWEKRNQEWIDSETEEPYPDDLKDIDGDGYRDSRDAAEECK